MTHVAELHDRLKKLIVDNKSTQQEAFSKLLTLSISTVKTYGYVRVSTFKQVEEGHSIEAQSNKIREFCSSKNLPPPIIFSDEGISGCNTDDRHSFNQMLSLVKPGDTIVSYSLSRLGRSTLDILNFVKSVKEKGINLYCLDKPIDTKTPEGNLFIGILSSVDEFEREQDAVRTSMVMQSRSRAGKLKTKGPFGYRAEGNKLFPVPEEQKVIEFIALFLSMNPSAKDCDVTRAVQYRIDSGELLMRKTTDRDPNTQKPLKRPCDGKKAHQSTISSIIRQNNLRDIIKDL